MGEFFLESIDNLDVAFSVLLNRALAATPVILAACLYRVLLRKAPKWSRILVWLLAGLRLALPVSVKSAWSLVPSETVLDYKTAQYAAKPELTSGIASFNSAVNPVFGEHFAANPQGSVNPLQVWMHIAGMIWAVGVLVLLVLALVSFLKVRRRVGASIECSPGVRLCDGIDTPFLLGLFRPAIYLPSGLPEDEREYVLAHEIAHKRHGDCVWKLLGYGLLCVYWFDPLVWLGYSLFCRDLELACDERVIKHYSLSEKKRYASVLLSCSVPHSVLLNCPLAFGEVGVKERVKRVLDKKPAKILVALALALCLVIGAFFATSREQTNYDAGLSSGSYVMAQSEDFLIAPPRVTFRMSGSRQEFTFMDSLLSSYLITGEFTIRNGVVTCKNEKYTLVFKIRDNGTIVLQMPGQSGLQTNLVFIPNGAEFYYEEPRRGTLTFCKEPASANTMRADFRIDFGAALDHGEVWAEYWQDGVCTQSEPLMLQKADEQLHLLIQRPDSSGQGASSVQLSMQGQVSDAVLSRFELPGMMQGFGFKSYEDGQELYTWDGESYVLAAFAPDFGEGVRLYDCIDLTALPDLYQNAKCMILVKAMFSADEFAH